MTSPLLYVWGDDDLSLGRTVDRFAKALATEGGTPLERWDLRGEKAAAAAQLAALQERIATPVMFGGGTLAVVSNVGALMTTNVGRDAMLAAVGLLAPGNALVILDATKSGAKAPSSKRLFDAIGVAAAQRPGGVPRQQSFNVVALWLFIDHVHGQPLSIPCALSSSASRLRA